MTSAATPSPGRVCLADDDLTSRLMLRVLLQKWGYVVEECVDGNEAFACLAREDGPRLALLDWMMPGMDGAQISARLRAEFPRRQYYLLLLTSRSEADFVLPGLRSGADDFISKPFTTAVLQARLEVGFRTLSLQQTISDYAERMESLAESRAAQLVHADRLATLGTLAASVAHEINNPASFLSVNVQTLGDLWPSVQALCDGGGTERDRARARALGEEMPKMLAEMRDGLERIRRITGELRSFARSGRGKVGRVELEASLGKALRMGSPRLKGKVEVEVEGAAGIAVRADAARLEQVFLNLAMNAADAMAEAPVRRLSIRATREDGRCRVRFQDTGPGVPAEVEATLFQAFHTTKPAGLGTGLGLYISRGIVEEFAGQLLLERTGTQGACFTLLLPLDGEDEA